MYVCPNIFYLGLCLSKNYSHFTCLARAALHFSGFEKSIITLLLFEQVSDNVPSP